jgi:hypothetical protein
LEEQSTLSPHQEVESMQGLSHTKTDESFIQVVESAGEWFVRIVEHGEVTAFQSFENEAFALSYADGQRLRMGLAEVQRMPQSVPADPAGWAEQQRREAPPGERAHPATPPPRDVRDWPSNTD